MVEKGLERISVCSLSPRHLLHVREWDVLSSRDKEEVCLLVYLEVSLNISLEWNRNLPS